MRSPRSTLAVSVIAVALVACGQEQATEAPAAREIPAAATTYFNGMIVVNHNGPKGQVWLDGADEPLWFSSARDTIAFTMLPGEARNIAVVYVNDMGRASWDTPEPNTWIEAARAIYVIVSDRRGGMGAPEAVPFGDANQAEAFIARHGGRTVRFDEMPQDYILSSEEPAAHDGDMTPAPVHDASGEKEGHDDHKTH